MDGVDVQRGVQHEASHRESQHEKAVPEQPRVTDLGPLVEAGQGGRPGRVDGER